MRRFLGLFLCTLSLAALLLPLPVLHFHGGEDIHIGAFAYHDSEASTCDLDHHDDQDKAPPSARSAKQKNPGLWVAAAPITPPAHALPSMNFPTVAAPTAGTGQPAPRPVSRGPPRSILALHCTLRV